MPPEKAALQQLINKFLEGNCTHEEKETLFSWMEQLDFVQDTTVSDQTGLLLKERIDQANGRHTRKHQLNWWKPVTYTAASIFLALLFVSLYYFAGSNTTIEKSAVQLTALRKKQTVKFYQITNTGKKPHLLKLDDGSTVLLDSKSTLLREVPFAAHQRKVELQGKAFFRIAKNRKRPFQVFSGNITTTALGTSFWVDQTKKSGSISVKLVTGKVVINDHRPYRQKLLGYLVPGQQLQYDIKKGTAVVSHSVTKERKMLIPDIQNITAPLVFAQTPMDQVLEKIKDYYKIKINYNPEDVRSMVFYGKYNAQDNAELILKTITVSNGLTLTKSGDVFQISK